MVMNSSKRINTQQPESIISSDEAILSIEEAQENVYCFLSDIVKQLPPEGALQEFKRLFIEHNDTIISEPVAEIYKIVISNNQEAFRHTIKRCCYILINNWKLDRNYQFIQKLIEILASPTISQNSLSPTIRQLRSWVKDFVISRDYQDLKLFAAKFDKTALSSRYSSNVLVAQSTNSKNPVEQREAAQHRAKQLNYRYKFDLAMYMAGSQSASTNKKSKNLDGLPDDVMHLIKTIVAKRNPATYTVITNAFLEQNKNVKYKEFKKNLQKYLIFSSEKQENVNVLKESLVSKLSILYQKEDEKMITNELILKTSTQIINCLTIENYGEPSKLFILLMSQGNPLTLVIVLLKIILVCRASRPHLETCIAGIIRYYEDASEENRKRAVNFLEIYNIMIAIYADNLPVKLN